MVDTCLSGSPTKVRTHVAELRKVGFAHFGVCRFRYGKGKESFEVYVVYIPSLICFRNFVVSSIANIDTYLLDDVLALAKSQNSRFRQLPRILISPAINTLTKEDFQLRETT